MKIINKDPSKDFILLNLSDPQLGSDEWADGHSNRAILEYTVDTLIKRLHPDLITVSGDLAWAGHYTAYRMLGEMLDSYGIPWTVAWGNHDNQRGPEMISTVLEHYFTLPNFVYEEGDPQLGNGNFVIGIKEGNRPVEGIIMMDTHDRMPYTNANGEVSSEWAKLIPRQVEWYKEQIRELKTMGCCDTTLITHIPIYAYRMAAKAAFATGIKYREISLRDSYNGIGWNDGYKSSFGVLWDGDQIASYPADEGAFDAIKELGSTKHVLAGHDHTNNFVIKYDGITLAYSLTTGPGCYWDPQLNGGTVITIGTNGVCDLHHEYVNVDHMLKK